MTNVSLSLFCARTKVNEIQCGRFRHIIGIKVVTCSHFYKGKEMLVAANISTSCVEVRACLVGDQAVQLCVRSKEISMCKSSRLIKQHKNLNL